MYKVLEIIKGVFETCETFATTSVIYDIVAPHVFPAVASERKPIKKLGLECLALYSLSDQTFGLENFNMFIQCAATGRKSLMSLALKVDYF